MSVFATQLRSLPHRPVRTFNFYDQVQVSG